MRTRCLSFGAVQKKKKREDRFCRSPVVPAGTVDQRGTRLQGEFAIFRRCARSGEHPYALVTRDRDARSLWGDRRTMNKDTHKKESGHILGPRGTVMRADTLSEKLSEVPLGEAGWTLLLPLPKGDADAVKRRCRRHGARTQEGHVLPVRGGVDLWCDRVWGEGV